MTRLLLVQWYPSIPIHLARFKAAARPSCPSRLLRIQLHPVSAAPAACEAALPFDTNSCNVCESTEILQYEAKIGVGKTGHGEGNVVELKCPREPPTWPSRNESYRVRVVVVIGLSGVPSLNYCGVVEIAPHFFRANRLLSRARTLDTSNWTYSRSRSSWPSFCISSKSSNFKSNSSNPRARPL